MTHDSAPGQQAGGRLARAAFLVVAAVSPLLCACAARLGDSPWSKHIERVETYYDQSVLDNLASYTERHRSEILTVSWGHQASQETGGVPPLSPCEVAPVNRDEYEVVVTEGKASLLNVPDVAIQLPPSIGQHAEFKFELPLNSRMEVIPGSLTEKLRQESYLRPRLLGRKLFPTRVVATSQFGMATVRFFFPREAAPGEPTIRGGESSVTFVLANGKYRVSAKFNPKEMACPDGTLP